MVFFSLHSLNWIALFSAIIAVKSQQFLSATSNLKPVTNVQSFNEESLRFKIDTAKLTISRANDSADEEILISSKSGECYECSYYGMEKLNAKQQNITFLVDTRWPVDLRIDVPTHDCSYNYSEHFGERGEYIIVFSIDKCRANIPATVITEPWDSNIPILVGFAVLLSLAVLYTFSVKLYDKYKVERSTAQLVSEDLGLSQSTNEQINEANPVATRERLKSIDTFRGICIVIMIFVNFKGGYYWFFRHSKWNGLTVADLVFPWFMFIMGINIPLSVDSLIRKNTPRRKIAYKVVRRTIILFGLGITIINHNTNWESLRIPGVLQRFAIAYLFAFTLQWAFHKSAFTLNDRYTDEDGMPLKFYFMRDFVSYWQQWIIIVICEVIWLGLTFAMPVPNCPTGYLGPGGLGDNGALINETCVGGAAGYIDRWMFGVKHIYGHPTCKEIYYPMLNSAEKVPYDPEGVLGSINSCIIVFFGVQAGKIFLYYRSVQDRTLRWLLWSFLLGTISIVLCRADMNGGWIPVNKNIWSTTFVTALSCMAFFLIAVIYHLVDVYRLWSGSPFDFAGMNSILLYVGHETFSGYLPFSWGANEYSTHAEWLAMNMLGTSYWVLIAYYCYKIKFFVKI